MPPPPPPPPGPPPPPDLSNFKAAPTAVDPKGRNMLLESIRQGKTLKKTTAVNDRSAPIVDAKAKPSNGGSGPPGGSGGRSNGLNAPPGLAGLFAGGMPKLKPVGSGSAPPMPRNASNTSLSSGSASPSTPRTPPVPPPASAKPNPVGGGAPLPPPPPASEEKEKRSSFGKPSLAPKPPALNGGGKARPSPPPKLPTALIIPPPPPLASWSPPEDNTTPPTPPLGVNRAQSMRMPKSASPTTPQSASLEYRTVGRSAGKAFAGTAQPPPPPRVLMNGGRGGRTGPLRPPSARPPPPPNKAPPLHAPPPPPIAGAGPPPPPHRTVPPPPPGVGRVNGNLNLGPLPSVPGGGLGPPPPPTRNSSMRSVTSAGSMVSMSMSSPLTATLHQGVDLEAKFRHLFHAIEELPGPEPYTGMVKTYPSKSAQSVKRQPAPPPPTTQLQLGAKLWVNNTSTC